MKRLVLVGVGMVNELVAATGVLCQNCAKRLACIVSGWHGPEFN